MRQRPRLSICIPTYNRAFLLKEALAMIIPQVLLSEGKVELVVSDNCSTDETVRVVQEAQMLCPIYYRCNQKNLGPLYNVVTIVTDCASGEYCWVLGDDDLVLPGAVAKILSIIENHSEIEYVFLNHSFEKDVSRNIFMNMINDGKAMRSEINICFDYKEGIVPCWEEIVLYSRMPALFTSIVSHVFKRNIFVDNANNISTLCPQEWQSFEFLFPHLYLLMPRVVGRPVYYVGQPYVVVFIGAQDWLGYWPRYLFTYVLEITDRLKELGVERRIAEHYRDVIFKEGEYFFRQITFKSRVCYSCELGNLRIRKEDDWFFWKGVKKYWRNRYFSRMVILACWREFKERMSKVEKRLLGGFLQRNH